MARKKVVTDVEEVKLQWMTALLSKKYKQTQGFLRRGDGFCCLGVLCDLHEQIGPYPVGWKQSVQTSQGDYFSSYGGASSFPPVSVENWAGLSHDIAYNLASLNDGGNNFRTIAKEIDRIL